MTDLTGLGTTGLLAYLLFKEALAFVGKRKNGKTNGSSGQQPISYWELEIRRYVREEIKPLNDQMAEIRDGIYQLVNAQESSERRERP
jgi:hypothetical protein